MLLLAVILSPYPSVTLILQIRHRLHNARGSIRDTSPPSRASTHPVSTSTVSRPASVPTRTSVSMRSPTMIALWECSFKKAQRRAHHQRIGLADEVRLNPGRRFDEGRNRAAGRHQTALARPARIGIGGDEARAFAHPAHGLRQPFIVQRRRLAHHHVIGFMIGQDIAHVVQRIGQAAFADDERRAVGVLRA